MIRALGEADARRRSAGEPKLRTTLDRGANPSMLSVDAPQMHRAPMRCRPRFDD
jgi:hypothetical protein